MSKGNVKNYGKSIRSRLLNIAKSENIYYQTVLTRYFQERLIYRISQTPYRQNFYLKGGALMYAHEKFAARPTLDIDFLGNNISNNSERIVAAFREICSVSYEEDGVRYNVEHITSKNITELKDYHGVRLSIPVSMDTVAQVLTMDIGFGDIVTPAPVNLDYPTLLDTLPSANILAYSLETVVAEKMHAVIDLADQSSRMKDYYDLYQILNNQELDTEVLQEAIARTFENRHTKYDPDTMFFRNDFGANPIMETRWKAFMKKITAKQSILFSDVVAYLQERLLPYWNLLDKREQSKSI